MVLVRPFAHSPSRFAEDGRRGHDLEAVDLGQVSVPLMRNNSARKSNCGLFPFFFWSRPFRISSGRRVPGAPIRTLLEILLETASFRDCSNECLYLNQTLMMDH